jgi:hypothetical protein
MVMLASAVASKGTVAFHASLVRLLFCHFDRPYSLESLENYRRETLHAQVSSEVLTRDLLQVKNWQTQSSLPSGGWTLSLSVGRWKGVNPRGSFCRAAKLQEAAKPFGPLDSVPQGMEFRHPKGA